MRENQRDAAGKRAIRDSRLVPTSGLMTYRFVLPLLLTAMCEQIVTSLMRITTSYRAVELGLSVVWLGIITAFAEVQLPLGMDVGADGTIYVVDGTANRVVHLSTSGSRVGLVGPAFGLPYDLEVADDGVVYLIDGGLMGRVRRIALDGTVTTVSRR